jgi:hypothetical protein
MSSNEEFFEKIDKVLERAPENRHSFYQLKYFVLGKEPTTQAQLWQCLKELQSRKETIETLTLQIEDTKDEIELIKIDHEKFYSDTDLTYQNTKLNEICKREQVIKARRLKRKVESLLNNIDKMQKKLEFEIQEAKFFLQAFEALEKVEQLKDYDNHEAQQEFWEAKISEEINLRILTKQPLPSDLLRTALSLHEKSGVKAQVINLLEGCKAQIQVACEKENNVRKQIDNQ